MPYKDLRELSVALDGIGRIRHVTAEVDKDTELACIARWVTESLNEEDRYAIQFDNIRGCQTPVLVGLYSSYGMYAQALNTEESEILSRWSRAFQSPISPTTVESAPVKETVKTGDQINLLDLPIPTCTPGRDAGSYISSASVITKDPETGIQNMGIYRLQIHDRTKTGLFFGTGKQHGAIHYAKYCKQGKPMPVAIVIGGPPCVNMAAAAKTAYGVDELEIAGGLGGFSVEVVGCESVDLLVPAEAEYVIEGFVKPDERRMEGPFGEALGYMNFAAPAPVVEVSALCSRDNPIFHGYIQQMPPSEGQIVLEMGSLGPLWFYLTEKLGLQAIVDFSVVPGAPGSTMLAVQVKLGHPEDVRQIGLVLSRINLGQRYVVIVDEDIDIHDLETLQWAVSTRVDPARDIQTVTDLQSYQLDPSILASLATSGQEGEPPPYSSSMMIIDATLKCDTPEISLPGNSYMVGVLKRWDEFGLPRPAVRNRLKRLLQNHSDSGVNFRLPSSQSAQGKQNVG